MKMIWNTILWIRQILFYLYVGLTSCIFGVICGICRKIGVPYKYYFFIGWLWSFSLVIGAFLFLWVIIEQKGKINKKKPALYLSKHQSMLETLFLPCMLPQSCFVLKKELMNVPVFGWGCYGMYSIAIDRKKGLHSLKHVVSEGAKRLKNNTSIIIFPEGTRTFPYENPEFQKSAFLLAKKNDCEIIPIAHNSGMVSSKNSDGLIRPGKITFVFCESIRSENKSVNELRDHCYNIIKNEMKILEK